MGDVPSKPVCRAAQLGDVSHLQLFLEGRGDPNERDQPGMFVEKTLPRTLLMYASQAGKHPCVQLLLSKEADPSLRDEAGRAAVHFAAHGGHTACCGELVKATAASASWQDKEGNSALHAAASRGHSEVVHVLLAAGANCRLENKDGSMPLHCAKGAQVVGTLLDAAPETLQTRDKSGFAVIHKAAVAGNCALLELLLDKRASANSRTLSNLTPLRLACGRATLDQPGQQHLLCCLALLGRGATVESGDALAASQHRPLDLLLQAWTQREGPSTAPPVAAPLPVTEQEQIIAGLTQALQVAERKEEDATTRTLCCVCQETKREVVFLPCKHAVCCQQCARALSQCPFDRVPITQKVEFILS